MKRITGENGEVEIASFCAGNIDSEDIVFDTISDIEDTLSARRAMVYDLLKLGLFADENGKLTTSMKSKLFEILGFGNWEDGRNNDEMHRKKALKENMDMLKKDVACDFYDDHAIHIAEHVRMCVSSKCTQDKQLRDRVAEHIAKHTELLGFSNGVSALEERFEEEIKNEGQAN